jgi:hypothetical protein
MSNEGPVEVFAQPPLTSRPPAVLDIVFVHGLGGHQFETWRSSKKESWLEWLAADFPNCRIFTVGYDSAKLAGILSGDGASIQDLALIMADGLASRDQRAPHMLLVAHSLGGLIVKQMLRRCAESLNSDFIEIGRSVAGVAFLATPHQGAQMAATLEVLLRQFLSKQSKQLVYGDDNLVDLNNFFRSWAVRSNLPVRAYYETEKTYGVHVVDKVTADPGVTGCEPVAVQTDHITICKPATRTAPLFKSICKFIRQLLQKVAPTDEGGETPGVQQPGGSGDGQGAIAHEGVHEIDAEILADFQYYMTPADVDRRDLEQKLSDAGRGYAITDAKRKKERFNMALQRHIAQPSAVTRYAKLMADVESRFSRHVSREIAHGADIAAVDRVVQEHVVEPCVSAHSTSEGQITAGLVDGALYYLAGNCHLAWDHG